MKQKLIVIINYQNKKYEDLKKTIKSIKKIHHVNLEMWIHSNENLEKNKDLELINKFFLNEKEMYESIYNESYSHVHFIESGDEVTIDWYRKVFNFIESNENIVMSKIAISENDDLLLMPNAFFDIENYIDKNIKIKIGNLDYQFFSINNKVFNKQIIVNFLNKFDREFKFHMFSIYFAIYVILEEIEFKYIDNDYYVLNETNLSKINTLWKSKVDISNSYSDLKKKLDIFISKYPKKKNDIINIFKTILIYNDSIFVIGDKEFKNEEKTFIESKKYFSILKKISNKELFLIKEFISSEKIKYVSFDMFDTLVCRPTYEPKDMFWLLSIEVNKLLKTNDFFDFKELRILSEKKCREKLKKEVTFDEIYDFIQENNVYLKKHINDIKKLEINLEKKFIEKRKIGVEILEFSLFLKKEILVISDMYFSKKILFQILVKNGIKLNFDNLYSSSDIELTKHSSNLYKYILNDKNIKNSKFVVHIGDNHHSDYMMAKKVGINSFWLPKSTEVLLGRTKFWKNNYFLYSNYDHLYIKTKDWTKNDFMKLSFGIIANKFFDNPYSYNFWNSDFNNDPKFVGYFVIGMFLLSITKWLAINNEINAYDNFLFNMRDGYLIQKSFKIYNDKNNIKTNTLSTFFSRKSLIPFLLLDNSFSSLSYNYGYQDISFEYLLNSIKNFISKNDYDKLAKYKDKNFDSIFSIANVFFECDIKLDEKKFPYKKFIENELKIAKNKNNAIFDLGYSGRLSVYLKNIFRISNLHEYSLHFLNNKVYNRMNKFSLEIKSFFPYKPLLCGWVREQLLSSNEPSCVMFQKDENSFCKVFDKKEKSLISEIIYSNLHNSAISFFKDFLDRYNYLYSKFQFDLIELTFPFEYFLTYSMENDREFVKYLPFENSFEWHNNDIKDFHKKWIAEFPPLSNLFKKDIIIFDTREYLNSSKWKKAIILFLYRKDLFFVYAIKFLKNKLKGLK